MHMPWSDLQTVEAVVRAGSVLAAARELGLQHSSVSRRLDALERTVGAPLFLKGPRLRPTPLALAIAARAGTMRGEAQSLEAELLAEARRRQGEVVITTNDVLAPLLFRALKACPAGPRVAVRVSDVEAELTPGLVDLALRPGAPSRGALRGRRVGALAFGVYRARHGAADAWVLPDASLRARASMRWWRAVPPDAAALVTCDSLRAMRDACAAGLGRAALPSFLAEGLACEGAVEGGGPVWLLSPPTRGAARGVQQLHEALFRALRGLEHAWLA